MDEVSPLPRKLVFSGEVCRSVGDCNVFVGLIGAFTLRAQGPGGTIFPGVCGSGANP